MNVGDFNKMERPGSAWDGCKESNPFGKSRGFACRKDEVIKSPMGGSTLQEGRKALSLVIDFWRF